MAFAAFTRDSFEKVLKERLSPTTPIRSPEFLRGRERKLEDIRRSLVAQGRHIFIYGDRGVGKTSLAQTAAYQQQSSDSNPILLACDPASGFYRIAHDLAAALVHTDPTITKRTSSKKLGINLRSVLSGEAQEAIERGNIPDMRSINEAVAIIDHAARLHSRVPVIVVDEFERIKSPDDRTLFADFIKQVGDQSVPLKLIFCGVGSALEELLDAHHSCYRYLTAVLLERLGFDGRLAIIDDARKALGLNIDDTTRYRIAVISDGFPHFVHLVCEKLFWEVFEDPHEVVTVHPRHFVRAIEAAVQDIEPHLKAAYEKATRKYNDDYEEVLWAVADDKDLLRRSTDIFNSYLRIMALRQDREVLPRDRFNQRMNALKQPAHGEVLKANRTGWYGFTENIVRGYVRLRAQDKGIELEVDHQLLARRFGWNRSNEAK
jgi:hypothetical protein